MNKKILLTTSYIEGKKHYDYWHSNISRLLRYHYPQRISYGLRFLKQNIPQIDILEYPSWDAYKKKLDERYDIVGFSFYTHHIPKVLRMVEYARKKGVKELWAGNYGALTYGMEEQFDEIFIGYSERALANKLGIKLNEIHHPVLIDIIEFPFGIGAFPTGILNTYRGCNVGCHFCQTPIFCNKLTKIPISSIDQVLSIYNNMGVHEIIISDETFGIHKKHTRQVVNLLNRYDMNWYPMTRVDIINNKLDSWYEKGFSGIFLGIESLKQSNLNKVGKNLEVDLTISLLEKLNELKAMVVGFYILGFEDDTEESIRSSIKALVDRFYIDIIQLCILTPFPKTKLWDRVQSDYGIFENDWSKWDTKHLVWNHPNISPQKMQELLSWGFRYAYPSKRFFETPIKNYLLRKKRYGYLGAHTYLIKNLYISNLFKRKKIDF